MFIFSNMTFYVTRNKKSNTYYTQYVNLITNIKIPIWQKWNYLFDLIVNEIFLSNKTGSHLKNKM